MSSFFGLFIRKLEAVDYLLSSFVSSIFHKRHESRLDLLSENGSNSLTESTINAVVLLIVIQVRWGPGLLWG